MCYLLAVYAAFLMILFTCINLSSFLGHLRTDRNDSERLLSIIVFFFGLTFMAVLMHYIVLVTR